MLLQGPGEWLKGRGKKKKPPEGGFSGVSHYSREGE
jgi:hypothetical protein